MKLLLSLHDVCPTHLERIKRAEEFFNRIGIDKITYLLIPAYHHAPPCNQDAAFIDWCRAKRSFEVDWFLHGYTHIEDAKEVEVPNSAKQRWKQKHLTANEGEFGQLKADEVVNRLTLGKKVFEDCLGVSPNGFVSPAWLFNQHLPPALTQLGIRFNENHGFIFDGSVERKVPVITWATRTPFKKKTSILGTPLLARLWHKKPVIRLAVHPFDFDHPETIASIEAVWQYCLSKGETAFYSEM